jgi:hypothetical protein
MCHGFVIPLMFLLRLTVLLCILFPLSKGAAQQVFINEIHYDNVGTDASELIEVAGPAGTDLSGYELVLYNGNGGGGSYGSIQLSGTIPNEAGSGFGAVSFTVTGLQNGGPDGVVLYDQAGSSVVQFLSYEGSFTAVGGVADGMASVDIGVSESNSTTAIGTSLQLSGSGSMYVDFSWSGPTAESPGMINAGQIFTGSGMPSITLTIEPGIVSETDCAGAAQGMIQLFPAPAQVTAIGLSLSEAGEVSVPVSVSVGVGGTASFSIDALTDGVQDGSKTVTVTAFDGGETYADGQATITVTDSDLAPGRNSALRIATLNVLNGVGTMGTAKFDAQMALLSRLDADVVAFQEVISSGDFADLKSLLATVGYATDAAHLATKGDGFSTDDCGDFGSNSQCVVIVSRHPITEVVQIGRGVAGRKEMTRYPLFLTIDVPGTTNDPALVAVHLKAGNSNVDHFRKAVEAYRIERFLLDRGYDG